MPAEQVPDRVVATDAGVELLTKLSELHGGLMIHQSGGCCDGSAPMCYPDGEFVVGDLDVLVGVLDLRLTVGAVAADLPEREDAVPVWISGPQFDVWKHTQLVIDAVPGRGSGFSLEAPEGLRFLSRGRAFTAAEVTVLAAREPITGAGWESGLRPAPSVMPQIVAEASDACPVPDRRSSGATLPPATRP